MFLVPPHTHFCCINDRCSDRRYYLATPIRTSARICHAMYTTSTHINSSFIPLVRRKFNPKLLQCWTDTWKDAFPDHYHLNFFKSKVKHYRSCISSSHSDSVQQLCSVTLQRELLLYYVKCSMEKRQLTLFNLLIDTQSPVLGWAS